MNVMIAGAGGILGKYLLDIYLTRGDEVRALVYSFSELADRTHPRLRVIEADVTHPETIEGVCDGVDQVISCIGITRMKGRLTHMDVDYGGNLNLLREAERAGVRRFGFVSPAGVDQGFQTVPLLEAKHRFEQELRKSSIRSVVFRAGGFFDDIAGLSKMAAKSPLFVIGDGETRFTPIHVRDLAEAMASDMDREVEGFVDLGGPEHMTWNEICRLCFEVHRKPARIIHVPVWLCNAVLGALRPFDRKNYAMGRLLVFMSTTNATTTPRGSSRLADFLQETARPREVESRRVGEWENGRLEEWKVG